MTDTRATSATGGEFSVLEAMATLRAVRRLRQDPIPTDVVESIIFYATRAPSAANRQPWEFVVVTDEEVRAQIGDVYRHASRHLFQLLLERATGSSTKSMYRDALYLSDHLGDAPVLVLVCVHVTEGSLEEQLSSVYPAVQNLMLAARAFGIGSVLTSAHKQCDAEVKELLGIPETIATVCLIPLGYPERPDRAFRRVDARRPISEVLRWQRFS